ncbi:hypothetical protein [Bosea sp. ANAM02]|uniref:hypothetical protein n=1 Tax=Bosea sp. ANAM02 TaxID=2020412 RepID=UPI00140EDC57|nr:hypothetical protein [Bosea sp. ANAM02]BCB21120.1 hypothetical protein OCUBac02_40140 [Bosea sp. ANAM02]
MAIDLTDEERAYVAQAAKVDTGFLAACLSSLPYIAPPALFGAYGASIGDVTAVALALACLVALNLWWLHAHARSTALFKSVCAKTLAEAAAADRPDVG